MHVPVALTSFPQYPECYNNHVYLCPVMAKVPKRPRKLRKLMHSTPGSQPWRRTHDKTAPADEKHVGDRNRQGRAERETYAERVMLPAMEGPKAYVKKRRGIKRRRRAAEQVAAAARTGLAPRMIKVYREAGLGMGLGTNGLWSLSQRNKAKALARVEPEPDINQINLFIPSRKSNP